MVWVDIPGWPTYQASPEGEVRRIIKRGNAKNPKPLILKLVPSLGTDCIRMVKDGKRQYVPLARIMADAFLGGVPDGQVIYYKNGDKKDHCWRNIGFMPKQEMGRRTGAAATRRPVAKIAPDGEITEVYSSARRAARENHCSLHYVSDRCNGKISHEFCDGFSFRWEV